MAKIVLAGKADCPYYAKTEILADSLVKNLQSFKLHKIVKQPQDWDKWLAETCATRGWSHTGSPIIWRELVDRGGKGMIIGGANDFQEYCCTYYGVKSDFTSDDMRKIATENLTTKKDIDKEVEELRARSKPLKFCITNASSPVCYGMINCIAQGDVLGSHVEVALRLLDSPDKMEYLSGVEMESVDLAYGLLRKVELTTNAEDAFRDCSAVVFLDEVLQEEDESDEDWLKRNNELFARYGASLNKVARPDVKVVVAGGGPINFNANMLIQNAPNIPKKNIVALARALENQAKAIIGQRLAVNSAGVVDTVIWGNINGTNIADVSKARVHGYEGAITGPPSFSVPAVEMVHDDKWLAAEFVELLQKRLSSVQELLGRTGSLAQASAILNTLSDWVKGAPADQMFSMGVFSEGHYGIPVGIVYSFPVRFDGQGNWTIVEELDIDATQKEKMVNIANELLLEKEVIYPDPNKPKVTITAPTSPAPEPAELKKVFGGEEQSEKSDQEKTDAEKTEAEKSDTDKSDVEKTDTDKTEAEQTDADKPEA